MTRRALFSTLTLRLTYLAGVLLVLAVIVNDIWWDPDYGHWSNIALLALAALVTLFTIRYAVWSNWRANPIGKVFLIKYVFLALVLNYIVAVQWWSDEFPGRVVLRFALFTLGAVAYVAMNIVLIREQRRDREIDAEVPTDE